MQLVVTGFYADGQVQDLTRAAQFASSDAAIVSGPAHVVIEPGGKRTELELYFTELYVKEAGLWRMALWQSTRLPAPDAAAPAAK